MRRQLTALAVLGAALLVSSDAPAEAFCDDLAIPSQLDLVCSVGADGATVVQGRDSPFAALNRLRIERLEEPVEDPAEWLRTRISLDTSSVREAVREWMTHPDNPLKPDVVNPMLDALRSTLEQMEQLSRSACGEPRQLAEDRWAMTCDVDLTVASGVLHLELLRTDGLPIAVDLRAASPQRQRQFEALVNGLASRG